MAEQVVLKHYGPELAAAGAALVMLHGRGGSAADMIRLGAALGLADQGLACLAPEAEGGTWYPRSFMAERSENEPGLSRSLAVVAGATRLAADALGHGRVVLMGFSQGACLACEHVARHEDVSASGVSGLVALTGGLIGASLDDPAYPSGPLAGLKVLLSTGDPDAHVPVSRVRETRDLFLKRGASVELVVEPGRPHVITQAEVERLRGAVERVLEG